MAHVMTTGALPNSSGSTATWQALTGRADYVHIRVDGITYMKFVDTTGGSATGSGTGIGLILSTAETNTFVCGKPGPKYICWVSTGTDEFAILETF
jgi:hypothetical protein